MREPRYKTMKFKHGVAAIPLMLSFASLAIARPFDDTLLGIRADQFSSRQLTQILSDKWGGIAEDTSANSATASDAGKPYQVTDNDDMPKVLHFDPVPDHADPNNPARTVKGLDPDVLALRNSLATVYRSQAVTHDMLTNANRRDTNVAAAIAIALQRGDVRFLDAPDPKFLTEANLNALREARTAIVHDQVAKALNTASEGKAPEAHRALTTLYNTPGLTNEMKNKIRIAHLHVDEIQQSAVKQRQAKNAGDAYMAYEAVFAKAERPNRSQFPNTPEGEVAFRRYSDHYYAGTYVPAKKSQANLQQAMEDMAGNWDKNLADLGLTQADASSPAKVNAAIAKKYGDLINQEDRTTLAADLEKRRVNGAATGRVDP